MANTNQSVRTCILKVDLKCCTGCQNKAKTKLQSVSGVSEAEYNQEKGLLTVTGDVEPMTLVHKLTKWGRKAELVSVKYQLDDLISDDDEDDTSSYSNTSSNPDPRAMKPEIQEQMQMQKKKKGLLSKYLLLGCLSSKSEVVEPLAMRNQNWKVSSKFQNGGPGSSGFPFPNVGRPPMMPHPQMIQQQLQYPMTGPPMPYNGSNMYGPAPPQIRPYYMSNPALMVNPKLHYK